MRRYRPRYLLLLIIPLLALPLSLIAQDLDEAPVSIKTNLSDVRSIEIARRGDEYRFHLEDISGRQYDLTPDQFAADAYERQSKRTWWQMLLSTSSWQGILWVGLGFLGQMMYTVRMLLQWIASEKRKESVVPPVFWWLSLAGASMLMVYFVWRKDIIGIMGQSTGWIVYGRNLYFIYKQSKRTLARE